MNIVYVTMEYIDPEKMQVVDGGLANYLHKITMSLHKKGHKITVLVVNAKANLQISYNGINVVFITNKYKKSFFEKIFWLFYSKKRRRLLKKNFLGKNISDTIQSLNQIQKIDIIQYANCIGTGRCQEKDIPSCVRISSYAKLWQKYYGISNNDEIESEQEVYRNAKFLFGPSKHVADYIKQDLNLKNEIKIIETPYSEFTENEDDKILNDIKSKTGNSPYLLFFGTIGELKGCKVISECIHSVLEKYPDLYFVLVGKNAYFINNIDYAQVIKDRAEEFSDRVIRYESQPHSKLYPVIRNSTGVLMPSLTENFSNACVEAMRLKKSVIGTEGNFSQLITDGVNGFLSKVNDSESLKEKIFELMDLSKERKAEIEQKAFERTEKISPDIICGELLAYYNYIIKNWENGNE